MKEKSSLKNRLKEYFDIDKNIDPDFPKNMLLELSNVCNHSCIFCANSKSTRKKCIIDNKLAKRILQEAYDLGTREVGFYSTGEPLVDMNLEEYVRTAKSIGYEYVYITTNGALLNKERAKSLVESGIDSIKFSINAGTKEGYKFIHGKDDFEKVINNLKWLDSYRKDNNITMKIYISCILTRYTKDDKELVLNQLNRYADDIVFLNCINQCGVMYEVNKYLIIEDEKSYNNDVCPLLFNKLHITCEGYLTACCADFQNYLAVADLNTENLRDSWNNDRFNALRKMHIEGNLKGTLCYNCINNVNREINPLREDISTKYYVKEFDKTKEILKRIEKINIL